MKKRTIQSIFAYFFLCVLFLSKSYAQVIEIGISNIGEEKKGDLYDTTYTLPVLNKDVHKRFNPKSHSRLANIPIEKQPLANAWATNSNAYQSITSKNVPKNMRLGIYNGISYQLVALVKTWYKGYEGNYCFFGTRNPNPDGRSPMTGFSFLLEDIDDFMRLETEKTNPNKLPFLDSLHSLVQKNIQASKEKFAFWQPKDTSKKNTFQLQIVDELKEEKAIKMYLLEKISGKKIEVFSTNQIDFQKKRKNEIEKQIQRILAIYMVPWDNPLKPNNTNAGMRIVWKKPVRLENNNKDHGNIGFPQESQMIVNNLTILTNNILVRQQKYGNVKFDLLETLPKDDFIGKTIELDMALQYEKKFGLKQNIPRKNHYILTIAYQDKIQKICLKEIRIADNDNAENLFELVEIIQNMISNK